jgi:hypothetical protein
MDGELNGDLSSSDLENLGNWMLTQRGDCYSTKLPLIPMQVMEKHPKIKGGYFCPRGTVVPPMEIHKMFFTFVKDDKLHKIQLIAEGKYRSTAMVFITLLKNIRVVILQDYAEMIINGRTPYLFLNPILSCKLFKDYVKVMTVALDTIHETEKTADVFSDELDNKISDFHNTLYSGLQNIATTINSSTSTSNNNHNSVMKGMDRLITKGDIRKAVEVIAGPVKHPKIIHALTNGAPEIVTDITENDNESDGDGSMPMNEQYLVREFIMKYTLDTNGIPCGWLDVNPSFMDSEYVGNMLELWKAWNKEGVDVITNNKHH